MAYTPTRQQKAGVRPTGVTQATGMQRLAQAFNKISERAERDRQIDRELLFDQAVIQAQADGQSSVKYDGNKLVPLTDTSYEPGMFYKADEAKIKNVFQKFLTQSYTTAFNVDVAKAAANALANNPFNPEAIVASAEEYEKQVNSLPDELQNAVRPSFIRAFAQSEISARSALQKIVNEKLISNSLEELNNIETDAGNHLKIAGLSGEPFDTELLSEAFSRVDEIKESLQGIYPATQLDAKIKKMKTNIQGMAFNGRIERVWDQGENYLGALQEIQIIRKELEKNNDGSLDVDRIIREGSVYLQSLQSVANEEQNIKNKANSSAFGILKLAITDGDITDSKKLQEHPEFKNLFPGNESVLKEILNNTLRTNQSQIDTVVKKKFQEDIKKIRSDIIKSYGVLGIPNMTEIMKLAVKAQKLKDDASGQGMFQNINVDYDFIMTTVKKATLKQIKETNDIGLSIILNEMNTFKHKPAFYKNAETVNTLFGDKEEINFTFGTSDENVMTKAKWSAFVDQHYTGRYNKYQEHIFNLNKAYNDLRHGPLIPGSAEEIAFNKHNVKTEINYVDANGTEQTTKVVLNTNPDQSNQEAVNASRLHTVKWSVAFQHLHPELVNRFKNLKFLKTEAAYYDTVGLYQTLQNVLKNESNSTDAKLAMGMLLDNHGIEDEWMKRATLLSWDDFKIAMAGVRSATSEKHKLFFESEGSDFKTVVQELLNEKVSDKSFMKSIFSKVGWNMGDVIVGKDAQNMYAQMKGNAIDARRSNFPSVGDVFMDLATISKNDLLIDPDLRAVIENGILGRIATADYNFGSQNVKQVVSAALDQTMLSLGNANFGIVMQGNGTYSLEKHPYMLEALKTVPVGNPTVLTPFHVFADVDRVLKGPVNLDGNMFANNPYRFARAKGSVVGPQTQFQGLYGDLKPITFGQPYGMATQQGDLDLPKMLKANIPFDGTYTVFAVRPDSSLIPLNTEYRYNFETSMDNEKYKEAYEDFLEGSWGQSAWNILPFMDPIILSGMVDNYQENARDPNVIESLTMLINKARYSAYWLTGFKHSYEPIKIDMENDYEGYEKFMDSLGSLGIY